jgi:hypothetical protein
MAGLLDLGLDPEMLTELHQFQQPSAEAKALAQRNALMQAGFAMMANNRGMSKGQAFGNAMGNGGMAGMDAYQGTLDTAQKNQQQQLTQGMQFSKLAQEQKLKQEQKQLIESLAAKHPQLADYIRLNPSEAMKHLYPQASKPDTPYFQFLPTANGYAIGDARQGTIKMPDSPVIRATDDPKLQGEISGAKEGAKVRAESQAKSEIQLPSYIGQSEETLKQIEELRKHPGMSMAVGKSSMLGVQKIPGTEAYGFMNRLGQLKGGAFLQAFESLKGAGQITEIEGKKATDAITRMDNATSEAEFNSALNDYESVIKQGVDRAKLKAGAGGGQSSQGGIPVGAVQYPKDAGKPGVKVPLGNDQRMAILANELQNENQAYAQAQKAGDLNGMAAAKRNIELLNKDIGATKLKPQAQVQAPQASGIRKYNPMTGRIE